VWVLLAGSRPGRAARSPRGAGLVGALAVVAGLRFTAPPAGASGSGMAGPASAGAGPWAVAGGHPACHRPGQAEQATARPASARPCVKTRLEVAGRAAARFPKGGPTADGMAGPVDLLCVHVRRSSRLRRNQ